MKRIMEITLFNRARGNGSLNSFNKRGAESPNSASNATVAFSVGFGDPTPQ